MRYRLCIPLVLLLVAFASAAVASRAAADLRWAEVQFVPSPLESDALSDHWRNMDVTRSLLPQVFPQAAGSTGVDAWFRFAFAMDTVPDRVHAIRMDRVGPVKSIHLNGVLVHDEGSHRPYFHVRGTVSRFIKVPPTLLHEGDNELLIRKHHGPLVRHAMAPVQVGEAEVLRPGFDRYVFLTRDVRNALTVASMVFGLLMLQIWFARQQERAIGCFGLLCVLSGGRIFLYFAEQPFVQWPVMDGFFYWVNCWTVALLGYFSVHFSGQRRPQYERMLLLLAVAFPALAALALALGWMPALRTWTYPIIIALAVPAIIITLTEARRRGERTLIALSLSFGGMVIAAIHDYLLSLGMMSARDTYWMVYALPIGFLVFGVHLVSRLVQAINEVERFNLTLEDRVAERTHQLEAANMAKTRFLASASHDLRQPVHTVGLLVGLLRDKSQEPSVKMLVDSIGRAISALEHLLKGLLDLSRLDADAVRPELRPVHVHDIFMVVRAHYEPEAEAKGLQLRFRRTDAMVITDPVIFERILGNLVSNAVRYTDRGGVLVGVRRAGREALRVEVHDTGIGIAEDAHERVFQEFYQVGNVQRDRSKGLGLGLSIVRRSARLLEHEITLHDRKAGGSCFSITLPRARRGPRKTPPASTRPADVPEISGLHIVLIEDEADVRESMVRLLVHHGCTVLASADAEGLLGTLRTRGQIPDLLLSDYRLPSGDGIQAIHRLREACGHDVPALLLTGSTDPADVDRIDGAGIPVLFKPFGVTELRHAIAAELAAGRAAQASAGVEHQIQP